MKRYQQFLMYLVALVVGACLLLPPAPAQAGMETPILKIDTGGHKAKISNVIFTKDGRYLISTSVDKTVQVWDVDTGEVVRVIRCQIGEGHEGKIFAAALSPDNKLLAVGGYPSRWGIRLINFQTGEVTALLKGHSGVILCLAFSPDSRYLVSGSGLSDKTARIWDVRSGKTHQVLRGHKAEIYAVAFSPDGSYVVTGSFDDTLKLWIVSSGSLITTLKGHVGNVRSAAFSPDGKYILSGSDDKSIRLWDGKTGRFIKVLARQDSTISALSISADGTRVVTGCAVGSNINNIFSIPSGTRLVSFNKHTNFVFATAISPNGTIAATGGGNNQEIYLWDINTGRVKQKMVGKGGSIWSVGFAKNGRSIAWGKTQQQNSLISYGPLEQSFQLKEGRYFQLSLGETLSVDAGYLRGIESVGSLSIRTQNGKIHRTLQIIKKGWLLDSVIHEITRDSTNGDDHRSLTLTTDGNTVISGGSWGVLTSYNSGTGNKIHDFIGHTSDVWGVAVSPDSQLLVSGSYDQTVRLWEIETGNNLLTIFHGSDNEWAAWTPEGFYTASADGDKYVGWHVNKGQMKPSDYYHAQQFRRYLYRPDIVADTLELRSSQQAIAKAGMADFTMDKLIVRAPVDITIASVKMTGREEAEVEVKLSKNKTTTPERITIFINGAQMLSESQRKLSNVKPGDMLKYRVKLRDKQNLINVLVENQWAETGDKLRYENPNWIKTDRLTGTLYVNAVGINRYPKLPKNKQLQSPGLDARSIADKFALLEGKLYKKVVVNLLTDENGELITASRIEQFLKGQSQKANPEDTNLIFLAGHGITDYRGNYQMVTADSDIAISGDRISLKGGDSFDWTKLHGILDRSRGKRVVIVDTCQAGSIFSENKVNIQRLVKDIHDVGAIVYSGTSRQQSALETIRGGVFTRTILAGIEGKSQYKDRNLLFTSLKDYVDYEVPIRNREVMQNIFRGINVEEKKGREVDFDSTQKPVSVIPYGMNDFVIYRK